MSLMAGYGVQLWPILQDLSQLKDIYGQRANTFVANSGVLQVFGVNDYETAKWLSLTIGQETRLFETETKGGMDAHASTSEGLVARDLLSPDEIMQLDNSKQILRVEGMPPILASKIKYWNDPRFEGRFDRDQQAQH